jgi:hypothetical protein
MRPARAESRIVEGARVTRVFLSSFIVRIYIYIRIYIYKCIYDYVYLRIYI